MTNNNTDFISLINKVKDPSGLHSRTHVCLEAQSSC